MFQTLSERGVQSAERMEICVTSRIPEGSTVSASYTVKEWRDKLEGREPSLCLSVGHRENPRVVNQGVAIESEHKTVDLS